MVLTEAGALALAGTGLGIASAMASTRWLRACCSTPARSVRRSFVTVPLLLIGICLLASWSPARRPARTSPMAALRAK